jgi:hypothetical protein
MAATTGQLNALRNDGTFRDRTRTLVREICSQIYSEDAGTPNHTARANFAILLIQGTKSIEPIIDALVTRTNLQQSTIAFDFDHLQVTTDATDGAILSQLATDWNFFAGIAPA